MESAWGAQPAPKPATNARAWIDKSRRSIRTHTLILLVAILGNGIGLGLQIHRVLVDPARTLGNSAGEMLVPALSLAICLAGGVILRRYLRRFHLLRHDTRHCLEMVLKDKQREINLTYWVPLAYLVFLGLLILGKIQSIAEEFESPDNPWFGVVAAAIIFVIASAFLFHRTNAFLKPEVRELKQTLESLVTG